jgi:hypothetical protein
MKGEDNNVRKRYGTIGGEENIRGRAGTIEDGPRKYPVKSSSGTIEMRGGKVSDEGSMVEERREDCSKEV